MSAELAIASNIKPYGMRVIDKADIDAGSMIDVTTDVIPAGLTGSNKVGDIFGDSSVSSFYEFDGDGTDTMGLYNITPQGNVSYVDGVFEQQAAYLGDVGHFSGTITTGPQMTISMWIKGDVADQAYNHLFYTADTAEVGIKCYFNSSSTLSFQIQGDNTGRIATTANSLTDVTSWTHMVFTIDIGTTYIRIYENGDYIGGTGTYDSAFSGGVIAMSYWCTDYGSDYTFDGAVSQVRVFNRTLTSTEIIELYNETVDKAVVIPVHS